MLNMDITGGSVRYINKLQSALGALDFESIDHAIGMIMKAWQTGRQVITFGNGGSAITALHYITDWNKMIPMVTGHPFRGRTLSDNLGLLTAYANDVSYDDIFVEQLKNLLQPGDLVIGISGSGNSENVIKAIMYANSQQAETLGLCGYDGGRLLQQAMYAVHVNVNDMQITEDIHAAFGHIVVQTITGKFKANRHDVTQEAVLEMA